MQVCMYACYIHDETLGDRIILVSEHTLFTHNNLMRLLSVLTILLSILTNILLTILFPVYKLAN